MKMSLGLQNAANRFWDNSRVQSAMFVAYDELPRALFVGATMGAVYSFRDGLLAGGEIAIITTLGILGYYAGKGAWRAPSDK